METHFLKFWAGSEDTIWSSALERFKINYCTNYYYENEKLF